MERSGISAGVHGIVLQFLLSDCLLFPVCEVDSQRKKNTVRNPQQHSVWAWQGEEQSEKDHDRDPKHNSGFNHKGALTRPAGVPDAEICADDSPGKADYASDDSSDPSPHGSRIHLIILRAERLK